MLNCSISETRSLSLIPYFGVFLKIFLLVCGTGLARFSGFTATSLEQTCPAPFGDRVINGWLLLILYWLDFSIEHSIRSIHVWLSGESLYTIAQKIVEKGNKEHMPKKEINERSLLLNSL